MKRRILFLIGYFLFWYCCFIDARLLFLFYNYGFSLSMPFTDWLAVLGHGSKMDWAVCAYLTALPQLWLACTPFLSLKGFKAGMRIYTAVMLVICAGIVIADMELYRHWGFRMDATALEYLGDPSASFGSIPLWLTLILLVIGTVFAWACYRVYRLYIDRHVLDDLSACSWWYIPIGLILTGLLVIPMRGGLKQIPMNDSHVYFHSSNAFANHAATNEVWHFLKSVSKRKKVMAYALMPQDEADAVFASLFQPVDAEPAVDTSLQVLRPDVMRPNILLIVMESISCRFIEEMGGLPGVTPRLNEVAHEGIRFTRLFAAGDRTDEGLLALHSGYPPYPTSQIMSNPNKTESMPFITKELRRLGYRTQFVYGGDVNFTGLRSYLHHAGYDSFISEDDFTAAEASASKWGVVDEVLLNRLFDECSQPADGPFFKCCMTGSSHEPYIVPMETVIHGSDEEHKFRNAVYYTDRVLGAFLDRARQTDWWDNTWVIITADHDSRFPGNLPIADLNRFRIPMFWLGGAVNLSDVEISKVCSQTDIAYTVLSQLDRPQDTWRYSKDILSPTAPAFAFYDFNNGFGWVTDSVRYTFDNVKQAIIQQNDSIPPEALRAGKAYMQSFSHEFIHRGAL